MRILLVDSDLNILHSVTEVCATVLKGVKDLNVVKFKNTHEALQDFLENPADLVITGLSTYPVSGESLARQLRLKKPNVSIILYARSTHDVKEPMLFDDLVVKHEIDTLVKSICYVLGI